MSRWEKIPTVHEIKLDVNLERTKERSASQSNSTKSTTFDVAWTSNTPERMMRPADGWSAYWSPTARWGVNSSISSSPTSSSSGGASRRKWLPNKTASLSQLCSDFAPSKSADEGVSKRWEYAGPDRQPFEQVTRTRKRSSVHSQEDWTVLAPQLVSRFKQGMRGSGEHPKCSRVTPGKEISNAELLMDNPKFESVWKRRNSERSAEPFIFLLRTEFSAHKWTEACCSRIILFCTPRLSHPDDIGTEEIVRMKFTPVNRRICVPKYVF